eukprot:scaffold48845_cov37-Tisochrysis_lutea.AAC.1
MASLGHMARTCGTAVEMWRRHATRNEPAALRAKTTNPPSHPLRTITRETATHARLRSGVMRPVGSPPKPRLCRQHALIVLSLHLSCTVQGRACKACAYARASLQ